MEREQFRKMFNWMEQWNKDDIVYFMKELAYMDLGLTDKEKKENNRAVKKLMKEVEELNQKLLNTEMSEDEAEKLKKEIEEKQIKINNLGKIPLSKIKERIEAIVGEKMDYMCGNTENDVYISLESYIAERCLKKIVKEYGIQEAELEGKSPQKKLEEAMKISGEKGNWDERVKNEKRKFFKIIDSILGNEEHIKLSNSEGNYLFSRSNCKFFDYLFAIFDDEKSKQLRKGNWEQLDNKFLNELCKGMDELAENENMQINKETVNRIKNRAFCLPYREMMSEYENLTATITYFASRSSEIDANVQFFIEAREDIEKFNDLVLKKGNEMTVIL